MTIIIDRMHVEGIEWAVKASGNPTRNEFRDCFEELKPDDYSRGIRLGQAKQSSGHDCFLKGITVAIDLYCPRWMQLHLLRYRFLDIVSAMSLQHNLKELLYSKQATIDLDPEHVQWLRMQFESGKPHEYMRKHMPEGLLTGISFRTNYLQLKTIVFQRRTHQLEEWREFCQEVMALPMFCEYTGAHYADDGRKD